MGMRISLSNGYVRIFTISIIASILALIVIPINLQPPQVTMFLIGDALFTTVLSNILS